MHYFPHQQTILSYSIIINSPQMLLNTRKKQAPSPSFPEELSYLKHRRQPSQSSKHAQHYNAMTSVLDLLLNAYPAITDELLTLKQALKKWHEHLQEETISRNRQLMEMRENLVVYVSKEIGVTLEEIGYYVKQFTDNYCDQDMRRLYIQYLQAIKKLQWDHDHLAPSFKHQAVQTVEEQPLSCPPTAKSISTTPQRHSEATIDSPLRKYKDIDIHKYIATKEENLDLEKRINQLNARIGELQVENKALRREIERLHDQNIECRMEKERELEEIAKLNRLLSNLKSQEEARLEREEEKRNSFSLAERKYDECESIRNALHKSLENAELEIMQKESAQDLKESEEELNKNYHQALSMEGEDKYKTVKKEEKSEYGDVSSQIRMLLLQAIAIESYIMGTPFD